jgi:hypothetical protein
MASGAKSPAVGSFLGTGAALNIRTVGFRPRLVRVVNVESGGKVRLEWFKDMADAAAVKTAAAGTITVLTTNGITPLSDGFTLGADTDVNVDGELCHFEAYE